MATLRLFDLCREGTHVLGPGNRYVIWVQGCDRHCPGCISPESWARTGGLEVDVADLAADVILADWIDGITISGGEPFLQADALALLESVRGRTELDRFAPPHMLERVALKEERLRALVAHPERVTISDVNGLLDETLVMEREAIRCQQVWEPMHEEALQAAGALLRLLEQSAEVKVPSLYDGSEERLQLDYWTHGAYGEALASARALLGEIESMPVDPARLKELQAEVERRRSEAERMIAEAAELGVLSEQRVIISNDVLNALVYQGWELKGEPDFMGGEVESDWREGTFALLSKPGTGEELSIVVLPEVREGRRGNQILFHRNDQRVESAGAFQARMEEIKREIEKSGYKLGALREPEHAGDGQIELLRDRARLRERGAAQQLRHRLSGRS